MGLLSGFFAFRAGIFPPFTAAHGPGGAHANALVADREDDGELSQGLRATQSKESNFMAGMLRIRSEEQRLVEEDLLIRDGAARAPERRPPPAPMPRLARRNAYPIMLIADQKKL
jgi:hypothetical protein